MRRRYREAGHDLARARVPEDVLLAFVGDAFSGVVSRWLDDAAPHPPEEMALWLARLLVLGPYGVLEDPGKRPGSTL